MKKILILLLCLLLTASITGCGTQSIKPIDTIEGNMKTYSEMSDGTWQCDGHINKFRLEQAITLIKPTDLTFTEISDQIGFTTLRYFSTAFKQYTGLTPTQYKNECRSENK